MGFHHNTVCHKYEFVSKINKVNTQVVEAFNNELKLMIKSKNGVKTKNRIEFLKEFCFFLTTSIIYLVQFLIY
ncbi:hypothetical protein H311_00575 [Anncaliia algerae PRA109]|nr:hypothetical protein H311_00575 [Anncaliia algerae PRA109]